MHTYIPRYVQTQGDAWFKASEEDISAGVCVLAEPGHFSVFPYENPTFFPPKRQSSKVRSAAKTRMRIIDSMIHLPEGKRSIGRGYLLYRDFEDKLIKLIWRAQAAFSAPPSEVEATAEPSDEDPIPVTEKELANLNNKPPAPTAGCEWFRWRSTREDRDIEKVSQKARPMRLIVPLYSGLGRYFDGSGISMLLQESLLDGPVQFFSGPVAQYHENSRFYSAVRPEPNKEVDHGLPHITIEMPVYKESWEQTTLLSLVLKTFGAPSVFSVKKAVQSYARHGATSTIFIHVDGLQLIPENGRSERRTGRFKKASNMNYGLDLTLEEAEERGVLQVFDKEEPLEERALRMACDEVFEESNGKWKPWASNGKSIRIGEIILLVDSDTIVPEDCLWDAARELTESPEVAIIQHKSDIMQGHIPSLLQVAGSTVPADGKKKIWSESNVSEDVGMALRLQLKGYIIRWATYSDGGFKKGVSLTVDDELNRRPKYSYGCSELTFNPLISWWCLGPVNKQLRTFVWSDASVHYKFTMMSYGIAAAAALSSANHFLLGFDIQVDGYYLHSFELFLAILAVFPGLGNFGYILLEYRLWRRSLLDVFIETVTWVPLFFLFFSGLSVHLTVALLAHMFSYNITWSATKKEVERSNFVIEVPRIRPKAIILNPWLMIFSY
ncbi:hypothetical protein F5141DRAFT_1186238 [Pisolithus sp. B1]|nr:hypothetical protein F5141DRAFT_1186238 [Pisolithus sp. B1]